MILSKPQMYLTKFNDGYEVCCNGNICASAPPTSFKARYVFLKAYMKMEYVDLCCLLSLCNNIHINCSSSHRCGFEPSSGHMCGKSSSACGGQVVFLRDLPFSPHLAIDSAQNE